MDTSRNLIAFAGTTCLAEGDTREVAARVKDAVDRDPTLQVLVFDDATSQPVEFDLRGTKEDVLARLAPARDAEPAKRGPGRPKLGVVAREVTLLPRHWEWLNHQRGGASAALRRLVDEARRSSADEDDVRASRESAYRFMNAIAGNEPGFEEAIRALFAGDGPRFHEATAGWPRDVREHTRKLAARGL